MTGKLKVNITNLRAVASGKEELDKLDLGITPYVDMGFMVQSAENIANITLNDGVISNPFARKILTDIYICMIFSNYDARTLTNSSEIDSFMDIQKTLTESGLLEEIYKTIPYQINSYLQLIDDCIELSNPIAERVIELSGMFEEMDLLDNELTELNKLQKELEEVHGESLFRNFEDDAKAKKEDIKINIEES